MTIKRDTRARTERDVGTRGGWSWDMEDASTEAQGSRTGGEYRAITEDIDAHDSDGEGGHRYETAQA